MKKILLIILVFSLSLFSLFWSLNSNSFNQDHFKKNVFENNIEEATGKDYPELKLIYNDLILYLKGRAGNEILEPHFNKREVLHMVDVQELFRIGFIVKLASLFISIGIMVYFFKIGSLQTLGRSLFKAMFINWFLVGLLAVLLSLNFNQYFIYFHHILFTNDLWLLNPDTDLLIQMLPEKFFSSITRSIVVTFLRNIAIIQGIAYAIAHWKIESNKNTLQEL